MCGRDLKSKEQIRQWTWIQQNVPTLAQSIEKGSLTFWLAIKKSTTGPGWIIMVVDTSEERQ